MADTNIREFTKRIEKHPVLMKRFDQLLSLVENSEGDIKKASEVELRVIKELRQMGNELLVSWGEHCIDGLSEGSEISEGSSRVGKKNSGGIARMEKSI